MTTKSPRRLATPEPEAVDPNEPTAIMIAGEKFFRQPGYQPNVPPARPWVHNPRLVSDIRAAVELNMNCLLTGPTGCGKTSVVAALAHEINQPLVRFNCDGETRVSNLRGMMKPTSQDGVLSLLFSLGTLAVAMREGWWVLLDEIDAALASVLFVLQPVLEEDKRELHIPDTGETIKAHPRFRVFATGNTIGFRASARARHSGTNPMNAAFIDRFGMVLAVNYPEKTEESMRVRVHCPDLDPVMLESLCRCADALRKDTNFKSDFSTRRLIQWAKLIVAYDNDALRAADLALLRKIESPTDAKVAREAICRFFDYSEKDLAEAGV